MANGIIIPPAGTPAPADTTTTPPATTGTTTTAAPTQAVPESDPQWLTKRLAQERAKGEAAALKAAGFQTPDEAKAAAAAAKTAADASKTAEQRALEAEQRATTLAAENERQKAAVTEYAARMLVGLTAEQQAVVKDLAGDDPAKQVQTITKLAPTWAAQTAATTTTTPTATAPAAGTRPATTAPAAGAPSGATPAPADARSTYESMRTTNPFAAAQYGDRNPKVYDPK